ncbi:hypothetical protein GS634_07785 [Ruegeria atlantica]|uniref:Uncharacterized protein n=1 Tax=Ruegeria atlantica TaxID=81569 RepID=A0AA91BYZ0_9RHOB|nr:hypothetical protein [Ruegeria atlantica]NOE18024.1 hypothetical protein [Ruegeria atlantica]
MDARRTAHIIALAVADYEAIPEAERPLVRRFVGERFTGFAGDDDMFAAATYLRGEGRFAAAVGKTEAQLRQAVTAWYNFWRDAVGPENMTF